MNIEGLTELDLEILEVLRMDPETADLLGGMLPEEWEVGDDALRSCLAGLEERGLIKGSEGWYGDPASGERVKALWWQLTGKGKMVVESRQR